MSAQLVLDTHAWVYWIGGPAAPALSRRARTAIEEADVLLVSAASCVEVAWLEAAGRLRFDRDALTWLKQALAKPRVQLAELTPEVAVRAAKLSWAHRDPNDRLIVATALGARAPLCTKDRVIKASGLVTTIW
jgi:PIN domain nuclease of toxin-antitoxin system